MLEKWAGFSKWKRASWVAQMVKNLSAVQETWVWSLHWEDPLEKEMATHYSILAWRIPWMEEPGRLQSMGSQRVGHDWATSLSIWHLQGFPCGLAGKEFACDVGDLDLIPVFGRSPGEGKGYQFQYSGLENSMDYIVHGVAKSWTGLSNIHFHFTHTQWNTKPQKRITFCHL